MQLRLPHRRSPAGPKPPADRTQHPGKVALWLLGGAVVIWGLMCLLGLLLTHVLEHTAFHHADLGTNRWFASHRVPFLNDVAAFGTGMAQTLTVILITAVLVVVLRWRTGRWYEAIVLVTSVVGEVAIFLCVTLIVPQRRPPVHRLDPAPPTSSYPSGHTGASIALYLLPGPDHLVAVLRSRLGQGAGRRTLLRAGLRRAVPHLHGHALPERRAGRGDPQRAVAVAGGDHLPAAPAFPARRSPLPAPRPRPLLISGPAS